MARLAVGLSGGVDSAVAALLAREAGHDIVGVHLRLHDADPDVPGEGCCGLDSARDARLVAHQLGIDLYTWDFRQLFEERVHAGFADTYADGRTPNPCITCNEQVKHAGLIDKVLRVGFDGLVTGHYIQMQTPDGVITDGPGRGLQMRRGIDNKKDQSYVLHRLAARHLDATVAPLGGLTKPAVRQMAEDAGISVAGKQDSLDLCFIPDGDTRGHLAERLPVVTGHIVTEDGRVLGEHAGIWNFTVGQRRGLGLGTHEKLFVTRLDATANRVIVGERAALAVDAIRIDDLHTPHGPVVDGQPVHVQIRAHGRSVSAKHHDGWLDLDESLYGVALGQSLVLYDEADQVCLGGGPITETRRAAVPLAS